ncbi:MAG: YkgJ family cysteine cluster protein [bacterium]|nr:YkgJ family cysteine cluster protein [bacterium]
MSENWKELLNFKCTCCGNCCREPIVLVTGEDIRRIVKHTNQDPADVVDFYKPSEIAWGKKQPGWINMKKGRRIMGLRRTENGCQYLGEDERCTIYEHRPITCRRYPFNVELDEEGDIQLLSISDSVECPYELDGENSLKQIRALCDWEEKEETPYNECVEAWNKKKKPGGRKKFLKFLGF